MVEQLHAPEPRGPRRQQAAPPGRRRQGHPVHRPVQHQGLQRRPEAAMRRLLAILTLTLALLGAGVVLPADTAEAHNWDGYSLIYCTAHKSASHVSIIHSWPYSLEPGIVYYVCTQSDLYVFAGIHQFFVGVNVNTGHHWRASGYQWCGSIPCEPHGQVQGA